MVKFTHYVLLSYQKACYSLGNQCRRTRIPFGIRNIEKHEKRDSLFNLL